MGTVLIGLAEQSVAVIPGYFDPNVAWPAPIVRALIWLPTLRARWSSIGFLLDTGAGTTCLHPLDAITKIGLPITDLIDPDKWERAENHEGVGGAAKYFVAPAYFALRQVDDRWVQLSGDIRIAEANVSNLRLPSLLGWDVLQQFGIVVDWPNRKVELQ